MTTRIDSARLQLERKKRAWTQQHLAEVSGLGIRTIQRIEKSGMASPESVQAIASCFELGASELLVLPSAGQGTSRWGWVQFPTLMVTLALILAISSFASMRLAIAEEVTLKLHAVVASENDQYEHLGEMILKDGEESEFQMNGAFKVLISPTILENSQILIALKIFEYVDGQYALTHEPSLTTMDGHEAKFRLGLKDSYGSELRISVLPVI